MLNSEVEIKQWLDSMSIEKYTISSLYNEYSVNVEGDVDISGKNLTYIPVSFSIITGSFDCSHNQLTSLKGTPFITGGDFTCSYNQISLIDEPKMIEGTFCCTHNPIQMDYKTDLKFSLFEHYCSQENERIEAFKELYKPVNYKLMTLDMNQEDYHLCMDNFRMLCEKNRLEHIIDDGNTSKNNKIKI